MPTEFIQHRSPQTNQAKAPYNFVPLPEKVLLAEEFTAHNKYDSDRHTGYIELEITTETPLYTRCAYPANIFSAEKNYIDNEGNLKSEFSDKDKPKTTAIAELQQFFHRGNAQIPVIPGSTLRGMTRSLVEIFSYSKISNVSKKQLVYRAVADPTSFGAQYRQKMLDTLGNKHFDYPSKKLKGGYLEIQNGNRYIRPAQEPSGHGESFVLVERNSIPNSHQRTGSQVFVTPVGRTTPARSNPNIKLDLAYTTAFATAAVGLVSATIVNTKGIGASKHMIAAIYEQDTSINAIEIPEEMWKIYEEDRDMQRGIPGRKLERANDPLFYLLDDNNDLVFFGSTMMFRLPYTHKAVDLIPEEIKNVGLDTAESIFGIVDEDSQKSIASRVFFSDAVWNPSATNESPFLGSANNGKRVPKILSSPKPTAFQLYLNQNEPNHHRTDATRWFLIKESSIKRLKDEGVPDNICEKIKTLIGKQYKSKEAYLEALNDLGLTFEVHQANIVLNCSSHELKTYDDIGKTEIRGFKRYWHKKNITEDNYVANSETARFNPNGIGVQERKKRNDGSFEDWKESKQHTIIRPVKKETKFLGRVYFENLTEFELGALLVSLDLPENMRHQIGMAKPYGLGSVKITPNLVLEKRESRYEKLFEDNGNWHNGKIADDKTAKIKQTSLSKFKNEIKSFFNIFSFNKIQRLNELYTLLAWEDTNPNRPIKNYTDVTNNQWRERHVLPFPTDIDQIEIAQAAEDIEAVGSQIVQNKKGELLRISEKKLLKKFGKRLLELDLSDGDKGEIATELFAKADSLGIDLSNSEWFEQIDLLAKQYQNK